MDRSEEKMSIAARASRDAREDRAPILSAPLGSNWLALSSASASFTASHTDPHLNEGTHEHTWTVTAWFPSEPFRDGRALKAALVTLLSAWEGTLLPPELWSGEALAAAIMHLLGNCVGVDISRREGFGAMVRM